MVLVLLYRRRLLFFPEHLAFLYYRLSLLPWRVFSENQKAILLHLNGIFGIHWLATEMSMFLNQDQAYSTSSVSLKMQHIQRISLRCINRLKTAILKL